METCGRELRSVAQFMRKHAEVLGKAEDYHENNLIFSSTNSLHFLTLPEIWDILEPANISGNLPKKNGGRRLKEKAFDSKLQGSK